MECDIVALFYYIFLFFGYTKSMGFLAFNLLEYSRFLRSKKSATLSGAIVYFIIIGLVPIAYLSSLMLSILGKELGEVLTPFIYPELKEVFLYVIQTAKNLGGVGNLVAGFVALYSSANVLFHLKSSGEVIYNYYTKNSIFKRLISLILTFVIICALSMFFALYVAFIPVINENLNGYASSVLNIAVLLVTAFILSVLLNFYVSPYKVEFREVMFGSMYTCAFSLISSAVFFIYIKYFAIYSKIYGAIAVILVFLSWLYLIVKAFIDGIVLNVYLMGKSTRRKKTYNKKIKLLKAN